MPQGCSIIPCTLWYLCVVFLWLMSILTNIALDGIGIFTFFVSCLIAFLYCHGPNFSLYFFKWDWSNCRLLHLCCPSTHLFLFYFRFLPPSFGNNFIHFLIWMPTTSCIFFLSPSLLPLSFYSPYSFSSPISLFSLTPFLISLSSFLPFLFLLFPTHITPSHWKLLFFLFR